MHYDYDDSRQKFQDIGLAFPNESWLDAFDRDMRRIKLTQRQVDAVLLHFMWKVSNDIRDSLEYPQEGLYYNYDYAKSLCEELGLVWLGDEYVAIADKSAFQAGFSQHQTDVAMHHCLWHVKTLFTPSNYTFVQRLFIAFYFLTGFRLKKNR